MMRQAFTREFTAWAGRGGVCIKTLAKKVGLHWRSLYNIRNGTVSVDTLSLVLPHMPADRQARVMAEVGLMVQPIEGGNHTLEEAAAGAAMFTSDYTADLANDGRIDHRERRKLRDKAHGVIQKLAGWLRRERWNERAAG